MNPRIEVLPSLCTNQIRLTVTDNNFTWGHTCSDSIPVGIAIRHALDSFFTAQAKDRLEIFFAGCMK